MSAKGVIVTSYDKSGKFISRSSAVFFDDIVLLHGNHLSPLLEHGKWKEKLNSVLPSCVQNVKVCTFIDENLEFEVFQEVEDENMLPVTVERVGRRFTTAGVWTCPLVKKCLEAFPTDDDSVRSCLSLFLLLKIPGDGFSFAERIPRWIQSLEEPVRGGNIIIETIPAGMQAFINSWSHGVVARLHGCLFLTDAIVHSGCTGAPVYNVVHSRFDSIEKGSLLGVVLGVSDNFTCGIALLPVLGGIVPRRGLTPRRTPPQPNVRRLVDETVCAISSGNLRGSGVVVDSRRGVVLTCSHVIQNDATTVKMHLKGHVVTCDVIYRVETYDLAVLKVSPKSFLSEHMSIAELPARTGDVVCLAGFPHVPPLRENDLEAFISFGCISKSLPHAILFNCSVSKGYSGGAIIRDQQLLGLVSFMETDQSGFGFALPATIFRDNVLRYAATDDVTHLKNLESNDENVKRFWNVSYSKL